MAMKVTSAGITFLIFCAFAMASVQLAASIWTQNSALDSAAQVTDIQLDSSKHVESALAKLEDPNRFRVVAMRHMTGQSGVFRSASELIRVLQVNIRHLLIGLLASIVGMFVTATHLYWLRRSNEKQSSIS